MIDNTTGWLLCFLQVTSNKKNVFSQLIFLQNKDEQRMGNAIFSSGEFFVVCI